MSSPHCTPCEEKIPVFDTLIFSREDCEDTWQGADNPGSLDLSPQILFYVKQLNWSWRDKLTLTDTETLIYNK